MRRTAMVLIGLVLAVGLQVGYAGPAAACSCAGPVTDVTAADRADAIFTGVLLDRRVADSFGFSGADPAVFTFEVDGVYRGQVAATQSIVTARDGATCGLELSGAGPFLVFARTEAFPHDPDAEPGVLRADLCGGSRPLSGGSPDPVLGQPSVPAPGTAVEAADVVDGGLEPEVLGSGAAVVVGCALALVLWRRRAAR